MNQCEGCGIVEGGRICRASLSEYRGYNICSWCVLVWRRLEERAGRTVEFSEIKRGSLGIELAKEE